MENESKTRQVSYYAVSTVYFKAFVKMLFLKLVVIIKRLNAGLDTSVKWNIMEISTSVKHNTNMYHGNKYQFYRAAVLSQAT